MKSILTEMCNLNEIDMDLEHHKIVIGYVIRKLVQIGINKFVTSWNHHRIPGPCKGIPIIQAQNNDKTVPYLDMPSVEEAVSLYNNEVGQINTNMGDLLLFKDNNLHELVLNQFNEEDYFEELYVSIMRGESSYLKIAIKRHLDIYDSF